MAKTCNHNGCNNPVFSTGYCKYHQYLRTDKKFKGLAKRAMKSNIKGPDFGFSSQIEMFKHIYWTQPKPIICMISGRNIIKCIEAPISLFTSHFAHLLPKGTYTYWRLNPRNIIMLHPEAHWIVDQGTQEDRDARPDWDWKAWDEEVFIAREEYIEFCKSENL